MKSPEKSWQKRLSKGPDALAIDFVESLSYDHRLYAHDIRGSIAHARMLCDKGIITKADFEKIRKGLGKIEKQIAAGRFTFDTAQEDIHMAVEAALIADIGDAGRKLHTGRSRNDQVATDIRLWLREHITGLCEKIRTLQKAFVTLAEKYADDIMPTYTHLQRAQPVSIGAYLLSFTEMFERDLGRLTDCAARMNYSPLGSGAVAGSTIALDRKSTAKELEFSGQTHNSIDAVSDRDFCAEFLFACSLVTTHLSRLAEDFILYMTTEFGFIRIDDTYCTSSSMMPQKRNPDMLELMRGKTGTVFGSLVAMLTILKAQPSTYNRDIQEDKIHVFAGYDTTAACVDMAAAIVAGTKFNTEHIAAGIDKGYLDATALAEYLVNKGVPFREAHGIVGALVAKCEKKDVPLHELKLDAFTAVCAKIEKDVYNVLGAKNVIKRYRSEGASGPVHTKKRIRQWKKSLGMESKGKR